MIQSKGTPHEQVNPPYTPYLWVDLTNGEIYTCVDNTRDANVWIGQTSSYITPALIPTDYIHSFEDSYTQTGEAIVPSTAEGTFSVNGNGYVSAGGILDIGLSNSLSFSFWLFIYPYADSTDSQVMSKNQVISTNIGWSIPYFVIDGSLNANIGFRCYDGVTRAGKVFMSVALIGKWKHFVFIVDRQLNEIRAYLNGSPDNATDGGFGPTSSDLSSVGDCSTASNVTIGTSFNNTYPGRFSMKFFRVYDRVLSIDEINRLYAEGGYLSL